jgi:hypothetical protein
LRRLLRFDEFHQQGLRNDEDCEGEDEDEKKALLGAGFVLRVLKVAVQISAFVSSLRDSGQIWCGIPGTYAPVYEVASLRDCSSCFRQRHRVVAAAGKRMTTQKAAERQEYAAGAVKFNSFGGVVGAGRRIAASGRQQRRDEPLVERDRFHRYRSHIVSIRNS